MTSPASDERDWTVVWGVLGVIAGLLCCGILGVLLGSLSLRDASRYDSSRVIGVIAIAVGALGTISAAVVLLTDTLLF